MYADNYRTAQRAMADLKGAVVSLLEERNGSLTNAQIGRALGIYGGHVGHEGHISRTILEDLRSEGVVVQNPSTKAWHLVRLAEVDDSGGGLAQ